MTNFRTYLLCCAAGLFLPAAAQAKDRSQLPAGEPAVASVPADQDADAPAATQAEEDTTPAEQGIVVTGSRLGRTSFNSPTPVNVVGEERVENLSITNVGDALNQLPAFRPLTGPTTNSYRASQNIAGRSLDLRGLGSSRTLTLINGQRSVPSADDNTFDLNAIPQIMVQRSEVVTGGASAAYGADAVAGVVNLILDTRFTGIKGEMSYGISEQGDGREIYAGFKAGTGFAGGRGHIVVSAEYDDEGEVGDFSTRDWGRDFYNFIPNPFFNTDPALSNGLPATVATPNVLYVMNYSGVISVAGPLQGTQFDTNGNLIPFEFGDLFNPAKPSSLMVGGDPSITEPYGAALSPLLVPTTHAAALGHLEYDLTDSLTFMAEVSYARVTGGPTKAAYRTDQNGAITILRDNAYLTPATAAAMDAAHVTSIRISRSNRELGGSNYDTVNDTWRAFAGLKGEIGGNWDWDLSYDYGQTSGRLTAINQRISTRWKQAVDAVFAPAGIPGIPQGTIICRSTITDPNNGCVPANVMGPNKISDAAVNWVNVVSWQTRKFTQNHVGLNLRGTLFHGWAGDISVALGAEYRTDTSEGDADPYSVAGLLTSNNASILPRTTQKVTEAYAEIGVPLLRDSPIGKSLVVDGAIRRTHYSLSGNATTWKVGVVYEPSDEFLFRVTRSHDIRAPSPSELNPNTTSTSQNQTDPKYNIAYVIPGFSGGNPNLELESANTFTAGVVFKPNWLRGFRLSLDYYDIKVDDAIDAISVPTAVALCRASSNPAICTIGTDANGNPDRILRVFATYQNVNKLAARGFELVANYSRPLGAGTLNVTVNGNYIDTLSTTLPDGSTQEFADVTGNILTTALFGVPKWRADAVVNYDQSTFGVTAQFQYIPSGILNRAWIGPDDPNYSPYLPNSINNNRVGSAYYLNLNARVKLFGTGDNKVELFGSVNNVFDRDPPYNLRLNANPVYFDGIGRRYRVGIRADW